VQIDNVVIFTGCALSLYPGAGVAVFLQIGHMPIAITAGGYQAFNLEAAQLCDGYFNPSVAWVLEKFVFHRGKLQKK
jgi:hypothetical protein